MDNIGFWVTVSDIKIPANLQQKSKVSGTEEKMLKQAAARRLGIDNDEIIGLVIAKRSIDARKKADIKVIYTLEVELDTRYAEQFDKMKAASHKQWEIPQVKYKTSYRPVIIGAGPAGLFGALVLAQAGFEPIILERGKAVEDRQADVDRLSLGILDTESNILFGEGGAGTFSDGKLTTGIKDVRIRYILETLHRCGASEEILYDAKPHVGTDVLIRVVKNIRAELTALGADFRFSHKLSGIRRDGGVLELRVCSHDGEYTLKTEHIILAIGHSARDTFAMLNESGLKMEPKPFSVGVRIEHRRDYINKLQFGTFADVLPAADYKLAAKVGARGVYTFCCCPGGVVVPAASEEGHMNVNGMSYFARDCENTNAAVLVNVEPSDFPPGVLGGLELQRRLEKQAFEMGGGNYGAPVQLLKDFMKHQKSGAIDNVTPSIKTGYRLSNLWDIEGLPCASLAEGILQFDRQIQGFLQSGAVLSGVETRSSSPVRITRGTDFVSSMAGVYPAGEGAGYAGGIMSAAVDGMKAAESIILGL